MSPFPRRPCPDECGLNLLAAVAAAAASAATAQDPFVTSPSATSSLQPGTYRHQSTHGTAQESTRVTLHNIQLQASSSTTNPYPTPPSLQPPLQLPPPPPLPPPLPNMVIRRAPTVPISSVPTISSLVTVRDTIERNGDVVAPSLAQNRASRPPRPLRIRNGRLVLGESEICGEISGNPDADRGLEVKFLFGWKRIVYEWYSGDNYAEARNKGGPYAKMEMDFDTVTDMQFLRRATSSAFQLSFSASPILSLQTQESMERCKIRAQKRQYRRVDIEEFPIAVCTDNHRIWMRSDDALRIARSLVVDAQELGCFLQTRHQIQSSGTHAGIPQLVTPVSNSTEVVATMAGPADPSMPKANTNSHRDPPSKSVSIAQLSQCNPEHYGVPSLQAEGISPRLQSPQREAREALYGESEVPFFRLASAAGAATNLLASPAPSSSPATRLVSSSRPRREESMQRLRGWFPISVPSTPFVEQTNMRQSRDTGKAQHEPSINRFTMESATPASLGRKRDARELTSLENDRHQRRLGPLQAKPSARMLQFGGPDLQSRPHSQEQLGEDVSAMQNEIERTTFSGR